MKILGLITARGGSKGVPRKNIRLLGGKPLLAYTAEAALRAEKLSRVVLSTEDEEIAETGRKYGLDVPFMRPAHLAGDKTPTLPVIVDALERLAGEGDLYDAVCLLQPTNPLRRAEDIDACIEVFARSDADAVVSVLRVPAEFNPKWVYWRDDGDGRLWLSTGEKEPVTRRQDLPPAFYRDGSVYVTRSRVILETGSLYGERVLSYEMNPEFSINIDTEEDWKQLEERFSQRQRAAVIQ